MDASVAIYCRKEFENCDRIELSQRYVLVGGLLAIQRRLASKRRLLHAVFHSYWSIFGTTFWNAW
jgi:hypothetical protein